MLPRALAVGLLAGVALACGAEDGPGTAASVSGVVLDMSAQSLVQIESLTLQDEAGAAWDFVGGGYKGVSPSHLRQHMVQGLPISVSFHEEGGVLVIDEIGDFMPGVTPTPHP